MNSISKFSLFSFLILLPAGFLSAENQSMGDQFLCAYGNGANFSKVLLGYSLTCKTDRDICKVEIRDEDLFLEGKEAKSLRGGIYDNIAGIEGVGVVLIADGRNLEVKAVKKRSISSIKIFSEYGFTTKESGIDHKLRFWTSESDFRNDPEMMTIDYYDLFVPEVIFEIKDGKFVLAEKEMQLQSNSKILVWKNKINDMPSALKNFYERSDSQAGHSGRVKGFILGMALEYLYSGREQKAKEIIQKMWPESDRERIWIWMKKKQLSGLLSGRV